MSMSSRLSDAYTKHQIKMAEVDVLKEMMLQEVKTITNIREKLISKYLDADHEERLRIRKDIEYAEEDLRKLGIYRKSLEHLNFNQKDSTFKENEGIPEANEKFVAWIDAFNDYARKQNESWRVELLAKALALESQNPGSVGQRALWFIGTVDEEVFHAFAALLDICSVFHGTYVIPRYGPFTDRVIPTCDVIENATLGHIFYLLSDIGLIVISSSWPIEKGALVKIEYDQEAMCATALENISLVGVGVSSLGNTISKLYDRRYNELGKEIFYKWIEFVAKKLEPL